MANSLFFKETNVAPRSRCGKPVPIMTWQLFAHPDEDEIPTQDSEHDICPPASPFSARNFHMQSTGSTPHAWPFPAASFCHTSGTVIPQMSPSTTSSGEPTQTDWELSSFSSIDIEQSAWTQSDNAASPPWFTTANGVETSAFTQEANTYNSTSNRGLSENARDSLSWNLDNSQPLHPNAFVNPPMGADNISNGSWHDNPNTKLTGLTALDQGMSFLQGTNTMGYNYLNPSWNNHLGDNRLDDTFRDDHSTPADTPNETGFNAFRTENVSTGASIDLNLDVGASRSSKSEPSRKRARSPGTVIKTKILQTEPGKVQGMSLVWQSSEQGSGRKLDDAQKVARKRKMQIGTCSRCKRLKQTCVGFKESPYMPCESCRKSNPRSITSMCILEASILGIRLFRMGPPIDNPSHPLGFPHRQDVLSVRIDGSSAVETIDLQLMQDKVGHILHITVSKFVPLPGDKLAYEGKGKEGPYKLEMPPYCIKDTEKARKGIVSYMERAKAAYIKNFLNRTNLFLPKTFLAASKCHASRKPLVNRALSIWAASRMIERTWTLCGDETLGIHRYHDRPDPWRGSVPVTPIMDHQLDQLVLREVLLPLGKALLQDLKEKVFNTSRSKLLAYELYLTFFILLSNAEMQLAHSRNFAKLYGLSGRFGPLGKYYQAESQFHAARTMLGHYHYICRGTSLLNAPEKSLVEFGLTEEEKAYIAYAKQQTKAQGTQFNALIKEHQYETPLYFCHQMLAGDWNPGSGHIEELPENIF